MSLATRCTACGTIFRVVQDQLRVSEGWVRCGRCAEVFNAQEQVFDIETEAPPPWPPGLPAHRAPASPAAPATEDHAEDEFAAPAPSTHTDSALPRPSRFSDDAAFAAPAPAPAPISSLDENRREPEWGEPSGHDEPEPLRAAEPSLAPEPLVATPPAAPAAPPAVAKQPISADATPSFMRPSKPKPTQGWGGATSSVAWYGLAALLSASLLLQAAHHFRDAIAALLPGTTPALQAMCKALDCEIQPWRRIDAVSVETSALTHAGSGNNYQLSLTLRNKSGVTVANPWVDLSLTDSSGALVARRMISPAQLTPSKTVLPAGSDLALEVLISTGSQNVTGYSVEIFHP